MITRSHCPRGAALRGYKYSSLLFAPGTVNPLISDLAWIKPQAHRKVGRQPGPPHATLSPCLIPSPETVWHHAAFLLHAQTRSRVPVSSQIRPLRGRQHSQCDHGRHPGLTPQVLEL